MLLIQLADKSEIRRRADERLEPFFFVDDVAIAINNSA